MKKYRFVSEYANYKKASIREWYANGDLDKREKELDKIVNQVYRGFITIDEGMRLINSFEKYLCEEWGKA